MVNSLLVFLRFYVSSALLAPVLLVFAWCMSWRLLYYIMGVDD